METIEWDPDNPANYFQHSGGLYHNNLKIPKVCLSIIDTPAFQRLDKIDQLGIVRKIFRQATHTRIEHCFGVADLARRVMTELRKKRKDVTGTDMLCVIIAGLCHDLGHGPFSHTFEFALRDSGIRFRHEEMSVAIFDHILKTEPKAKKELFTYLNEQDIQFIRELIDPPKEDIDGNFNVRGRGKEKIWMYEIVSNNFHGMDIDKMDYIIRDSHHTEVGVACNLAFISRCIEGVDVSKVPDGSNNERERLVWSQKLFDDISNLFNSRKLLFSKVYYHKKMFPLEFQLRKAIRLSSQHLKFKGSGGEMRTVVEALGDVEAYIKLDDHILTLIQNSEINHPDMIKAKKCIEKMDRRELHTSIAMIHIDNYLEDEIEEIIKSVSEKYNKSEEEKLIYVFRHLHFGKGLDVDPMKDVVFSPRCKSPNKEMKKISKSNLKSETTAFIYGWHGIESKVADQIFRELESKLEEEHYGDQILLENLFKESS
ncbi:hypothetical protein FO519_009612 [Halicephalobus sp. NKZ332]|nr:hypothetical protein FO519_009612 [Halicephalobus sp. NKZ332]